MSSLTLGRGTLTPVFDPAVTEYQASVPYSATTITVRPVLEESHATVTVNGEAVVDGQDSKPVALSVGKNTVTIEVTAENGVAKMTYAVTDHSS